MIAKMLKKNYTPDVFKVNDPPCDKCHQGGMDFKLFENFNGDGLDWVQWFCKNDNCGHFINVELV
nr:hypothetical protein [Candidatus Sigynarchaeota archaeon]